MNLSGVVHNITFRNNANGWTVLRMDCVESKSLVTVVGTFAQVGVGESWSFEGDWIQHAKFGKQFQATNSKMQDPTTGSALLPYLSSGVFPGIGPVTAQQILDLFGDNTVHILDQDPDQLKKIRGLKGKRLERFIEVWQEHRESRTTLLYLHEHNISPNIAAKLWKHFGSKTMEILQENPYMLAQEIWGVGFQKADAIAMKIGFKKDSPLRLRAGLAFSLERAMQFGHCYLPAEILLQKTAELLLVEGDEVWEQLPLALEYMLEQEELERRPNGIWLRGLARAESSIAQWVRTAVQRKKTTVDTSKIRQHLQNFEKSESIQYAPEQAEGICTAIENSLYLLTGGPGTGKTTTLKGILHLLDLQQSKVLLAAPTGRAAKRMNELTGRDASTLHRLLEIEPGSRRFARNRERPLEADWVVVDEFSMVDTWMMYNLTQALRHHTKLLLIGDPDQLPAIGPGNVLGELLSSPLVPHMRLQKVFRQKGDSDIALNAHQINAGHRPNLVNGTHFLYAQGAESQDVQNLLANLVQSLPDARHELQVLTPMHRGPLGTQSLNETLQNLLNAQGRSFTISGRKWRQGDRVMQLKNDYDRNIFNGDVGFIGGADVQEKTLTVVFDGKAVVLPEESLDHVTLAYACTVHKSQGSEYKYAVVILDSAHNIMLQRNLLYTAVTRAKGKVWIFATPGALDQAIHNNRQARRYTDLALSISQGQDFLSYLEEE